MNFYRLDTPDALVLMKFRSEIVCKKVLWRAPPCLDLRARGPNFAGLYTQHAIYRFKLIFAFWTQWRGPFLLNLGVSESRHDILTLGNNTHINSNKIPKNH